MSRVDYDPSPAPRPISPDSHVGLDRLVDIGLMIAPLHAAAPAAAKSLAAFLDAAPDVPVRLAGVGVTPSRVHLTLAVCLGSVPDVKAGSPGSRAAVRLIQQLVDEFGAYDPAFTLLPDAASAEARAAERLASSPTAPPLTALVGLLAACR